MQAKLNSQDVDSFPKSGGHINLGALMIQLFRDESGTQTQYTHKCNSCTRTEQWLSKTHNWTLPVEATQKTLNMAIKQRFDRAAIQPCRFCRSQDVRDIISLNAEYPPPIIAFGLEDHSDDGGGTCQPKLTAQVTIGDTSRKVTYKLRGLIYWDKSHFT